MSRFAADAATLSAAVLLFLLLATYQIDLPGLYYDEALDAVPAMQIAQRVPTELHRDAGVTVGRYTYPLMVMDYVGPVNTYLLVPVFRLFGAGVLQIRLPMIALAATGLILSYVLVRRLFDRWTAAAAALLLAASPSFIFFSRQGIHVTSVMLPLLAGALLALDDWRRSGRHATLLLGAFLLGVGLAAKLLFLWFVIAGFLVSGFWFLVRNPNQKPETRNQKLRPFRDLAPVALAFVAGASPLVVFNLMTGGTVDVLGRNLATTGSGVDNAALLANLLTRFDNLRALLVGDHFWYFGDFPGNSLAFSVFLSGGLLGLLAAASPVPPAASSVMLNRSEASPRPEREAPGRCFAAAQHDNAPGRAGAPAVLPGSPSASPDASAVPSDVLSTMPCASSPARGSASAARGSPSFMLSRSEASPRTEPEAPGS
ncbi:MAG: glycosyltransferase family 39 protein [Chloroflexi bacterium]|nr:glycosyltransferase family 39 protein [Chloroflexota bacterium]